MNVAMLGAGYVGLVSSACLPNSAPVSPVLISIPPGSINSGKVSSPSMRPGLADLINKNMAQGRLSFRAGYDAAIAECDLVFIAVGTPARAATATRILKYVYQAARDIAPYLEGYTVIVDKSTVPVGTARDVKRIVAEVNPGAEF